MSVNTSGDNSAASLPTMKDVARLAGVSHMTVSRVVNGGGVSAATRLRVEAAARQLGYAPNDLARGLVSRASRVVGVLASDITNPFIADVVRAIHRGADEAGYVITMCVTDYDEARELRALEVLVRQRIAGLLVTPPGKPAANARIRALAERGLPVVAVSLDLNHPCIPLVIGDVEAGAIQAARHLLDLGHRRIAFITGTSRVGLGAGKLAACRATLAAAGIAVDDRLIVGCDHGVRDGYLAMQALLGRVPRPTAVMALTDPVAIGAMGAIEAAGLRIPDDIAVVGFDDIAYAASAHPPLTTVHQPTYDLGRFAARLLFDAVRLGVAAVPARTTLPCALVVRGSTGPARGVATHPTTTGGGPRE